jgi:hypothetical protein
MDYIHSPEDNMKIGNVTVPVISLAKISNINRSTEAIGGLGRRGYVPAEFIADLPTAELTGSLLKLYGGSRTLQQYKEDVECLAQRRLGYNYVSNVKGRSGWVSCSLVDVDDERGELWPIVIEGAWYDAGRYKQRYSSNPVTLANDWDITGNYDQSAAEEADDVQCYDGTTEIYSTHHIFTSSCVILNGLYRVTLTENTIAIDYWSGSAYTKIDDFTAGTFDTVTVLELNEDSCIVKTNNDIEITVERGRDPHIYSPVDLACNTLAPADQSTSSDNYLVLAYQGMAPWFYVCSNQNFSITDNVIDAGHLWIFQEETDPQTVAHNVLMISNLKRQVVER